GIGRSEVRVSREEGNREGGGQRLPLAASAARSLLLLLLRGLLVLLTIQLTVLITVGRREVQPLDLLSLLLADHAVAVLIHFLERRSFLLRNRCSREAEGQERSSDSCFHLCFSMKGLLNVREAVRPPFAPPFCKTYATAVVRAFRRYRDDVGESNGVTTRTMCY